MFSFFKLSPTKMRAQQLHDNQVSLLQHKQAAAYHQGMCNYLSGEISRLSAELAAEKEVARVSALSTPVPPMPVRVWSGSRSDLSAALCGVADGSNKAFGDIPAGEHFTYRAPGVKKDRRETNLTAATQS